MIAVITIGKIEDLNILGGDFPRTTEAITATEDLKKGSILNSEFSLINSKDDNLFGVLAEDLKAGETGVAYLTGTFSGTKIIHGTGVAFANVRSMARNKSIFIVDGNVEFKYLVTISIKSDLLQEAIDNSAGNYAMINGFKYPFDGNALEFMAIADNYFYTIYLNGAKSVTGTFTVGE